MNIYTEDILVRPHECGQNERIKLHGILNYFQDIAAEHAKILRMGMEDLALMDRLWVLSRLKVKIFRYPMLREKLFLRTYPTGILKLFVDRQYEIYSSDQLLAVCSSLWLILNAKTLRPQDPSKIVKNLLPDNRKEKAYFQSLDRINFQDVFPILELVVGVSDIDLNGHLNNAVYARYIEDVLGMLIGKEPDIDEIQINFQHAGELHDHIKCGGTLSGKNFYISGGNYFCAEGKLR